MKLWEKLQSVILLASALTGLALGRFPAAGKADALISPLLMCMLFGLFLGIPLADLKKGFSDRRFALTSLAINFIWIPVFGWLLGGFFLSDHPALRLGFIMLLVTPCTDWYLVFTAIARGNVPLSASILPLNLIVQVALLPVYLFLFAGLTGSVDLKLLLQSVVMVLVLPFGAAQAVRRLWPDENQAARIWLDRIFSQGQFAFLCLAIITMFASQAGYLTGHLEAVFLLLKPVLLFFALNFVIVRLLAAAMNFTFPDSVSLSLTTLARNSPIALAIAVTAFPNEPMAALALVIGPLIELPVLGLVAQILLFISPEKNKTALLNKNP